MNAEDFTFTPESEGRRAVERESLDKSASLPEEEELDVRKMIIYSEILKPKF